VTPESLHTQIQPKYRIMSELTTAQVVLLLCVGAFTLTAAIYDLRFRKIPNKLTAPMCVAGIVYQVTFFHMDGLWASLLGFAAGFGILFVLWMIATAGGGDVKLMAALGTWLGWLMTLKVLFCSLIFVTTGTIGIVVAGMLSQGFRRTKDQYLGKNARGKVETSEQRKKRRVMAFAVPVALATWCILALQLFLNKGQ
jgi:prepilin peptidase CpaA